MARGSSRSLKDAPVTKRTLTIGFKYGLGLLLLVYVVWRNWNAPPGSNSPGLSDALGRPVQIIPLLFAVCISVFSLLLTFVRWYVLVRAQDLPFTAGDALRLGLIGYYFSTFLPGSVGGDLVKAAFLAREQNRRTVAVATVLVDRVVGLWGLALLVALVGGIFWLAGDPAIEREATLRTILWTSWGIMAASGVVWLLSGFLSKAQAHLLETLLRRTPWVGGPLAEMWLALWLYRQRGGAVLVALLLAVVGHFGFVLTYYFAAQIWLAPGEEDQVPTLVESFLIVPVGMTFQAFFPSPGGVGGGEAGFSVLFGWIGRSKSYGVLASLAQRLITWVLAFGGYLLYLRLQPRLQPPAAPASGNDQAG